MTIDIIKVKFSGVKPNLLDDIMIDGNGDGKFCKFSGDDYSRWIGWRVGDLGLIEDGEIMVYIIGGVHNA